VRSTPLARLAVVVLVPVVALFGLWRLADGRGGGSGTAVSIPPTTAVSATPEALSPQLATPLMSLRRTPGLVARDINAAAFGQDVAAFATTLNGTSCLIVELDGVEVGAHNPDVQVIPASNQKLLTAAAALHVLGPDYRYITEVRADGVSGGVVAGDLYLVGAGDPLLRTPDWDGAQIGYPVPADATDLAVLAQSIVDAGVTRIDGSVVGDGARYDDVWYFDAWGDDIRVAEAGPISALLVNDDRAFDGEWFVADSPNTGAAFELTRMLEARGVQVAGEPDSGPTPPDAQVIASVSSAPMTAVIHEMLNTSDNNTAEMVVKEMGVVSGGGGTTAAGLAAMTTALTELGIDTSQLVLADGSGLSTDNRATCRAIGEILALHLPGDALAAGLPVAAQTGTLSDAFADTPMAGVLLGKTGTLGNPPYDAAPPAVKALSGYVPVEGGGAIAYALILNDPAQNIADQSLYRPIWDDFAELMASYPSGPSAAQLGPG
jgi:D-alanyl-D-alanine carboxypeptidase/D-alanyl-D-alanine-endopeptidase (penicillin-binding protein 4)